MFVFSKHKKIHFFNIGITYLGCSKNRALPFPGSLFTNAVSRARDSVSDNPGGTTACALGHSEVQQPQAVSQAARVTSTMVSKAAWVRNTMVSLVGIDGQATYGRLQLSQGHLQVDSQELKAKLNENGL